MNSLISGAILFCRLSNRLLHLWQVPGPQNIQDRPGCRLPQRSSKRRRGLCPNAQGDSVRAPLHLHRRPGPHSRPGNRRYLGLAASHGLGLFRIDLHGRSARLRLAGGLHAPSGPLGGRDCLQNRHAQGENPVSAGHLFRALGADRRLRPDHRHFVQHVPSVGFAGLVGGAHRPVPGCGHLQAEKRTAFLGRRGPGPDVPDGYHRRLHPLEDAHHHGIKPHRAVGHHHAGLFIRRLGAAGNYLAATTGLHQRPPAVRGPDPVDRGRGSSPADHSGAHGQPQSNRSAAGAAVFICGGGLWRHQRIPRHGQLGHQRQTVRLGKGRPSSGLRLHAGGGNPLHPGDHSCGGRVGHGHAGRRRPYAHRSGGLYGSL